MRAIIRSWVTQYRLIIEDEVQAGRQALTYALNSRRDSLGGFPALSFYYFLSSLLQLTRTLILASLMRLCYFSPYPWQLDHRQPRRRLFDSCKPIFLRDSPLRQSTCHETDLSHSLRDQPESFRRPRSRSISRFLRKRCGCERNSRLNLNERS